MGGSRERREGRDIPCDRNHVKEALRTGRNYDWGDEGSGSSQSFPICCSSCQEYSSQPLPTPSLVTFLLFFQSLALTTPSGSFLCVHQVKSLFLWQCFIVMHLHLFVRGFNSYRSYSVISIRTRVVSVFYSTVYLPLPDLLQYMEHIRGLISAHWNNVYILAIGEVITWIGDRVIFEIANPIRCQALNSFNP